MTIRFLTVLIFQCLIFTICQNGFGEITITKDQNGVIVIDDNPSSKKTVLKQGNDLKTPNSTAHTLLGSVLKTLKHQHVQIACKIIGSQKWTPTDNTFLLTWELDNFGEKKAFLNGRVSAIDANGQSIISSALPIKTLKPGMRIKRIVKLTVNKKTHERITKWKFRDVAIVDRPRNIKNKGSSNTNLFAVNTSSSIQMEGLKLLKDAKKARNSTYQEYSDILTKTRKYASRLYKMKDVDKKYVSAFRKIDKYNCQACFEWYNMETIDDPVKEKKWRRTRWQYWQVADKELEKILPTH